jgi:hypothetical protein
MRTLKGEGLSMRKGTSNEGVFNQRFNPVTDVRTVAGTFIADQMTTVIRETAAYFVMFNYQSVSFLRSGQSQTGLTRETHTTGLQSDHASGRSL